MNKWRIVLAINIIALVILTPLPVWAKSAASRNIVVKVSLDKDFYQVRDKFKVEATVINKGKTTKKYNRLTISIFSPLKENEQPFLLNTKLRYKILRRDWYKTLPPGKTSIEVVRAIDNERWKPGVYPVEFKLTLASQEKFIATAFLTILKTEQPQIELAVGLNLHQPIQQSPDKLFIDNRLIKLVSETTEKPTPLWAPLMLANQQPQIKLNFIISPILVKQISSLSRGYRYKYGQNIKTVTATQKPALNAKSWLELLSKQAQQANVELVTTSFSHAPLLTLDRLNWDADVDWQITKAKAFWRQANLSVAGFYPFNLTLNSKLLKQLAKNSFSYVFISSQQLKGAKHGVSRFADESKLSLIAVNEADSRWLSKVSREQLGNGLAALLAHYANKESKQVALVAPKLLQTQTLKQLIWKLKQFNWVKVVSFSELVANSQKIHSVLPSSLSNTKRLLNQSALSSARKYYLSFAAAVEPHNVLKENLQEMLLIAETGDWQSNQPALSLSYINFIKSYIRQEFTKIKLSPPTQITFSTLAGKIPIPIKNEASYPFKIVLRLKGINFKTSKKQSQVVVAPKENLLTYDLEDLKYGSTPITIEARAGRMLIAQKKLTVSVSSNLRLLVVSISSGLIAVLILLIFLRFFRIKIQPKKS